MDDRCRSNSSAPISSPRSLRQDTDSMAEESSAALAPSLHSRPSSPMDVEAGDNQRSFTIAAFAVGQAGRPATAVSTNYTRSTTSDTVHALAGRPTRVVATAATENHSGRRCTQAPADANEVDIVKIAKHSKSCQGDVKNRSGRTKPFLKQSRVSSASASNQEDSTLSAAVALRTNSLDEEDKKPAALPSSAHHHLHDNETISAAEEDKMSISSSPSAAAATKAGSPQQSGRKIRKTKPLNANSGSQTTGRWTDAEHQAFLQGLQAYGREWKKVASHIPTRTSAQVRSHAQKYFAKLQREEELAVPNAASTNAGEGDQAAAALSNKVKSLPSSVQSNVERILAEPESVEAEVEETLHLLHERYRQLQRRLEETTSSAGASASTDSSSRKRRARDQNVMVDDASSLSSLQDQELIALSVLQGSLRQPRNSSDGSSSVSATGSEDEDDDRAAISEQRKRNRME